MNSILLEYVKRFSNKKQEPKLETFFTSFDVSQYRKNLPYIYDIDIFCVRMLKALKENEKICIYADYDTDAVTATAAMYWGLIYLGFDYDNISFYTPDRFTESYGMNTKAITKLAEENNLIISVDCGINSTEEAEIVKNHPNCDLIITDHHHLSGDIPEALGVLNPQMVGVFDNNEELKNKRRTKEEQNLEDYTKHFDVETRKAVQNIVQKPISKTFLSQSAVGATVAWFSVLWLAYFMLEIDQNNNIFSKEQKSTDIIRKFNQTLSVVAIGTIADCQSVTEQTNRMLIKAGIQVLQKNQHNIKGLEELTKQSGLKEKMEQNYKLTSQDLGFTYSPILNSSGRVSHAKLSIECLLSKTEKDAKKTTATLIETNQKRKQMVKDILEEVEQEAENQVNNKEPVIWLEGEWSKGIIGLLASRLVNKYNKPCIVVSNEENGQIGGSCRAPEGYHLPNAMKEIEDKFVKFGGHPGAAGFSAEKEKIQEIEKGMKVELNKQAKRIDANQTSVDKNIPKELQKIYNRQEIINIKQGQITKDLKEQVWSLDPFGQDFPFPNFLFIVEGSVKIRWIGIDKNHAKVTLSNSETITMFNLSEEKIEDLKKFENRGSKKNLWIQAKISQNTWNNKTTNELIADQIWFIIK